MDNPYFNIFAHPTGRLFNQRKSYEIDIERVMDAAVVRGCFLELNAQPERLDLDDSHCHLAKSKGLKISIAADAHGIHDFNFMRFGIDQARRGWLEAEDVINTYPISKLRHVLKRN
jgi:DNA polymerase (family 10)